MQTAALDLFGPAKIASDGTFQRFSHGKAIRSFPIGKRRVIA